MASKKKILGIDIGGSGVKGAPVHVKQGVLLAERFRLPIMLSETNIRGTFHDRLSWLTFMEEQCEAAAARHDFRGFCWYPSIDSTDWCNCCTRATGTVDPQGIWGLSPSRWERIPSDLSVWYSLLAAGMASAVDLPAYELSEPLANNLRP